MLKPRHYLALIYYIIFLYIIYRRADRYAPMDTLYKENLKIIR